MKITKTLLISLVILLMVPAVAEALVEVSTRTTLQASKTKVRPGTTVKFSGKLSARHSVCYKHQTLKIYKNGSPDGVVTTNSFGSFSFYRTIKAKVTYAVAFFGKIVGMHPHQKICKASAAKATVDTCKRHHHRSLASDKRTSGHGCH